jgi:predicted acyl esterase
LRVSHRKTDAELSRPYRPWHTHDERQPAKPGEIVPVDVEIWPTSLVLRNGYRLQVEIRPHDPKGIGDIRHLSPVGRGHNTIYTGGNRASYLLLPVLQE